jgi:hypothetical protein
VDRGGFRADLEIIQPLVIEGWVWLATLAAALVVQGEGLDICVDSDADGLLVVSKYLP